MKKIVTNTLEIFQDTQGKEPFIEWLESLDSVTQTRIRNKLTRIELGNFGDCQSIGDGLLELRLFFGPGYRIYFGIQDEVIILLLIGGNKKSQAKDIKKAKKYWEAYKRTQHEKA